MGETLMKKEKVTVEQLEKWLDIPNRVFYNIHWSIPSELRNTGFCSCGEIVLPNEYFCPSCKSYSNVYMERNSMEEAITVGIWYDLEVIDQKRIRLNRYDLIYIFNFKERFLKKEVKLKGYLEYNFDDPVIYAHILKKDGKYRKTKNIKDLVKHVYLSYLKVGYIPVSLLEKCEYLYQRTGLKEFLSALYQNSWKYEEGLIEADSLIGYLHYFKNQNNPEIELLLKSGQEHLALQLYKKEIKISDVFGSSTKASEIIQLPSFVQNFIKKARLKLNNVQLLQDIHLNGKQITKEFFNYLIENDLLEDYFLSYVKDLNQLGFTNQEIYNYLQRADLYQAIHPKETLVLWRDYIRMAKEGNFPYDKFPNSLKKSHDLMAREYKFVENEIMNGKFQEAMKKVLHFEEKGEKYSIITPKSTSDIVREGKVLRHCVASYIRKVANGETVILFVRENEFPEAPFYTMEVRGNTITQVKGFCNKNIEEEDLREFLLNWAKKHKFNPYGIR